ncbi:hypothetical protein VNI00_000597 [Paramarasmius palmivorus]|uniref:NAD(P)-binding protein n=1 Tax=Paramarasmius palmivorus TaxID=297713 RepID=A0AAW0E8M7_9AGAR
MHGKTVLITGSTDSRSLGWTAAKLLATGDYGFSHIILSGRRDESGQQAAQELRGSLPQECQITISALTLDVTDSESIQNAVALLVSTDGLLGAFGGRLDVLVNNAGIGVPPNRVDASEGGMFLPTEKTTAADVMTIMNTNVAAVVELTNALLPLLAKSNAPRVINVSSARGSLTFESGLPSERTGGLVYNASKAALNMVTVMQSKNLPAFVTNLKVNAATPGHTKTPCCRMGTYIDLLAGTRTLEEGAGVIVHLATLADDGPSES